MLSFLLICSSKPAMYIDSVNDCGCGIHALCPSLQVRTLDLDSCSSLKSCVTVGMLLSFLESVSPHLLNEDTNPLHGL